MLIIMFAMLISLPALAAKPEPGPAASPPLLVLFDSQDPTDCTAIGIHDSDRRTSFNAG
jgi:hypothetical protein